MNNNHIENLIMQLVGQIESLVSRDGGSLVGYASVKDINDRFHLAPDILDGLDYAISLGARLNKDILKTNVNCPSHLYKHHYRHINMFLDRIAHNIANLLISEGYRAVPIPASIIIDWEKQLGHISHREVANLAGLGWRGKNNLLVNRKYGSGIRLATVLTDLVLEPSTPVKEDCGSCFACQAHCPAGAIKDTPENFDRDACCKQVKKFSRKIGVGICGLCLNHCPEKEN